MEILAIMTGLHSSPCDCNINKGCPITISLSVMSAITSGVKFSGKWTIGEKIGEGSCGSVFSLRERDPSVGDLIIKCIKLPTGRKKATDKELAKVANTLSYERTLYKGVLNGMDFCVGLPLFHYFGEDHGYRYLVMERLDCDLRDVIDNESLSISEVAKIGLAILQGLEAIHKKGYLFVDVKPDNFMLRKNHTYTLSDGTKLDHKLYFVDFGLVEKYRTVQSGGAERERSTRTAIAGTPSFASIDVLSGFSPSRKDDIEALVQTELFDKYCRVVNLMYRAGISPALFG